MCAFAVSQSAVTGYLQKFRDSDMEFGVSKDELIAITGLSVEDIEVVMKGLATATSTAGVYVSLLFVILLIQ